MLSASTQICLASYTQYAHNTGFGVGMWRSSWKFAFVECEFWCTNPHECECEYWKKKLKYDTINTSNMMQSTNITSNDCQCECKIEI